MPAKAETAVVVRGSSGAAPAAAPPAAAAPKVFKKVEKATSKAEASLVVKSFGSNMLPTGAPTVGVSTLLKKKEGDTTLSLQFNDATLRDPKSGRGVVLTAEKPLGGG